jgi:plastocyanin
MSKGRYGMFNRTLSIVLVLLTVTFPSWAGDIQGTILIQHKLTKRKVTPSASLYDRGMAVELGSDQEQDPLAFERSHVVIYLDGDSPSNEVTTELNQENRRFAPDLVVIPAGSTVSFPNLDPIFHNVFSLSKTKSFDLGNYPQDHTRIVTFPKPGIVFVNCHLHPNMSAVIVVTPNRWSARADATGHFALSNVPPGTYTITAWHKTAGFFKKTITVSQEGSASVEFAIPLDENGVVQQARK